nr:hypothetical protein [Butyrivibrio sp.]
MKKGIFKKILATVMTVAVMGSILPSGTADVVKASDTAVKSVTANHVYSEVLPGGTNIEYLYTVPSNGYFYITLTPNYYTEDGETSSSTSWWIPYTLKSKSNYKQYESGSAHYRNGTYQSENYCFAKGTTISFTTSSSSSSDYNWYYTIEFHQVKPSNYEVEGNGERKKASKIKKANKTY